jgi:phosphate transport system permease protein
VLLTLVQRGIGGFSWAFFTQLPHPPGEPGGGLANAVVGTALVTSLASMCGIPAGIAAGVWLAEFSHGSRLGHAVRFLLDVLMGIPSIVIGVFVYGVLVAPLGGFSAMAGAVALALLMLPIIARTTEEMLRAVPVPLREASLALGAPIWRTVVHVAMRAALPGILTGVLLSIARVAGETAPLLFTALNSPYWSFDLHKPIGTLNVTLFQYAMSPYAEWQQLAWAAALVITGGVLALTLLGRLVRRRRG